MERRRPASTHTHTHTHTYTHTHTQEEAEAEENLVDEPVHIYVTSSYILCHIIIHAMSHHHTCYVTSSYMLKEDRFPLVR